MKYIFRMMVAGLILAACGSKLPAEQKLTLKEALRDKFLIGTSMNTNQITGKDTAGVRIIREQFNAIGAENCMKSEVIHPEENRYDFTLSDRLVEFGEKNGMAIIGHTLIWHSQLAPWFCVDANGKNISPELLKKRMKEHITTIVGRYKGRIKGWDVVNEALLEDSTYRKTKFYEILGEEYIPLAFQYAHEADPDAELYYNDYSMADPARRWAVVQMVNKLKKRGVRIDAVGMQGHLSMDYPSLEEYEKSINAFAATGVKVMITELDMSALPAPRKDVGANVATDFEYSKEINPYPNGLPDSVSAAWNQRMADFFRLFLKHSDVISRVTVWGVTDGDSWKNNWPVRGRTDYPLLFDRNYQPKAVVDSILNEVKSQS